jgi:tight adherence protein B
LIVIAAIALGLVVAGGVIMLVFVLTRQSRDHALERRVAKMVGTRPVTIEGSVAVTSPGALGRSLNRRVRSVFAYRMTRTWGITAKPSILLTAGAVAVVGLWGLAELVLHLPGYIALLATAGGFFLIPRLLLKREQRRAEAQFSDLLPDAIDMVVRMVRAGLPVGPALRIVGDEADPPLSTVFTGIANLADIGIPLAEALATTGETVGSADFRFFGVAVALQQATGGNLAATLETLSEIIRKRRAVRLKARAATAEIRISAIVLGAIPFFIVGALLVVSPGYLEPLISDPRGNFIVGAALLSLLLAFVTMRAMMRTALRG